MTVRAWSIAEAWETAALVIARAYQLDPGLLTAPTRGRGPRPPEKARLPKKLAIGLAVNLADCGYKALADHLGMHKDTVASHCAELRDLYADDTEAGALMLALEDEARGHLRLGAFSAAAAAKARLAALEAAIADEFDRVAASRSYLPSSDRNRPLAHVHPTETPDHANVIELPRPTRNRR